MREILFRGKHKGYGQWVYGDLLQITNMSRYSIMEQTACVANIEVIPETVGQYTGLSDKNGKKIFEGDIVEIGHDAYHGSKGEVFFKNGSFMLKNVSDVLSLYGFLPWCEVIGNIHDNPELLEVNKNV